MSLISPKLKPRGFLVTHILSCWETAGKKNKTLLFSVRLYLLMIDFEKNFARATKTWLPSMGPKELIGAKEVQDLIFD